MQCTVLTANSEDVTVVAGVKSEEVRFNRDTIQIATSCSIVISAKKEQTGREGRREDDVGMSERVIKYTSRRAERDAGRRRRTSAY